MSPLLDEYDFVIVGSGGASMCAALAAKRYGLRPVILEKQALIGGSTALSGGVWWVPNNPISARAGLSDSYERAMQYLASVVKDVTPATSIERRDMLVRAGPKMVDFLEEAGMQFSWAEGWSDYHDSLPGGEPRGRSLMPRPFDLNRLGDWRTRVATYPLYRKLPVNADESATVGLFLRTWAGKKALLKLIGTILASKVTGRDIVTNGAAMQARMLQMALREGVPIHLETPVEDLWIDSGRVVGVKVRHQGEDRWVRAGNVLLNSGGFARNKEMREKYQPLPTASSNATAGDTGELLLASQSAGVVLAGMDGAVWLPTSRCVDGSWPQGSVVDDVVYPPIHVHDLAKPHCCIVDGLGQRYVNEATSYVEVGERMYRRHGQTGKAAPSWFVMDSRFVRWYGIGTNPPGLIPKQWYTSRYLRKASTLEALAADCGIDPAGLRYTVDRFNGFAKKGQDDDFQRGVCQYDRWRGDPRNRPNPSLGSIEVAPYYAIALYPGDVGTSGGLLTDRYARALREDGSVLPGLYAAGNCAASVFGRCYPGAGASIGSSFTFGFVAALHAAGVDIDAI